MTTARTLIALSLATLATACAGPGAMHAASTSPNAAESMSPAPSAAMQPRMKAMHEAHHKMANAKTPAERQALMAEHMKAMNDGMAMMKEMHGKKDMGGMGGMGEGPGKQAEMAKHHQMMTDHSAMMQLMMDMMAQRMAAMPATM